MWRRIRYQTPIAVGIEPISQRATEGRIAHLYICCNVVRIESEEIRAKISKEIYFVTPLLGNELTQHIIMK